MDGNIAPTNSQGRTMNSMRRAAALAGLLAVSMGAAAVAAVPGAQMTPAEIAAMGQVGGVAGSSNVATIRTTLLTGDPTKPGLYTLRLALPPNTTVQAHAHKDDRAATVVSGDWEFGYGPKFDPAGLKVLPPGSYYTEPGGMPHFARAGAAGVVIQITGFGPSDTLYVDPANDPTRR